MRMRVLSLCCVLGLASLWGSGCDGKRAEQPQETPSPRKDADSAAASAAQKTSMNEPLSLELKTSLPEVTPQQLERVDELASKCSKGALTDDVRCTDPLVLKAFEGDVAHTGAAMLPMLLQLLSRDELSHRYLATSILSKYQLPILESFLAQPDLNKVQCFERLIEIIQQSRAEIAPALAPLAMGLSIQLDRYKHLKEVLSKHPVKATAVSAYASLMGVARDQAPPLLFEIIDHEPDVDLQRAALASPLQIQLWTLPEQREICGWAVPLLSSEKVALLGATALLVRRCDAEGYEALIARASEQLDEGKMDVTLLAALDYLCGAQAAVSAGGERCQKLRELQERLVLREDLLPHVRVQALRQLQHQWADEQTSQLILSVAKSSKERVLLDGARQLLEGRTDDAALKALKAIHERELTDKAKAPTP